MAREVKTGSVKRFGARYGRRVRNKVDMIESQSRKLHKCPYCNQIKAKKQAIGIFLCRKCGSKFTGRAFAPAKLSIKTEAVAEVKVEKQSLYGE